MTHFEKQEENFKQKRNRLERELNQIKKDFQGLEKKQLKLIRKADRMLDENTKLKRRFRLNA